MAYNKNLGYDPDKDYSIALQDTSLSASQRTQLENERQAKIDHKYGGNEPNMTGTNTKFSDVYKGGSSGNSQYAGTNYHQDAIDAAQAGNWEAVYAALAARDDKTAATGQNYGRTSADILSELMELYAKPEIPEMPSFDGGSWGGVLDNLANQLVSMNYDDWTNSEQYQALVDRYGLQGKQSMQDMLGQISSRTGGLASSYAATAAQQQYNDYMATLEQAALDMYGVNRDDLMQNAQLVHSLSQDEYNRYLDSLDQYWNQMQFNSNQQKQNQAMAADKAETLAGFGDFSGYKALGYSDSEIAMMQAAYQSQMAAEAAKGKTGSGGGGGGGGKMTLSTAKEMMEAGQFTDQAVQTMLNNGFNEAYLQMMYGYGGNTSGDGGGDYWLGDGSTSGGKTSLNWDQDEGIFTWNGKNYSNVESLLSAIESANLTASELEALKKKFGQYGFNLG